MAKGKHATALFEVIHTAKRPPQGSPAARMPVPRSWWKSKGKPDHDAAASEPDRPSRLALMGALLSPSRAAKLLPEKSWSQPPTADPGPTIAATAAPTPPFVPPTFSAPPAPLPPMMSPARFEPPEPLIFDSTPYDAYEPPICIDSKPSARKGVSLAMGGELNFRLSYGGAIAAAMILLLLVAIAYLAGSRSGGVGVNDPSAPDAPTAVAAAPANVQPAASADGPNTGMLAAVAPVAPAAPASDTGADAPSAALAAQTTHHLIAPARAAGPTANPAGAAEPVHRQIGRHYVIVQSYPDRDVAIQARDFLARHGVRCTVIRALPGWALRSWYSIVDVRAFDRIRNNPVLDDYMDHLTLLGDQFAGETPFNRFEPKLYRWRADADAAAAEQ